MTVMYNGSKGPVDPATMEPDHLLAALAKLLRDEPQREAEIEALKAQAQINSDKLDADRAPLIRQGWRLTEDFDALGKRSYNFTNANFEASGSVSINARSKDGAWAKFIDTRGYDSTRATQPGDSGYEPPADTTAETVDGGEA